MIKVNQYVKTAFSIDDARTISGEIDKALENDHEANLDFEGIQYYTTLFFNNAVTKYIMKLGPSEYKEKFHLRNLNSAGKMTYEHSLDNAESYYSMSEEARKEMSTVVTEVADESSNQ